MPIPGFVAEASLYRTPEHYQVAEVFTPADGAVYPARPCCDAGCSESYFYCVENCGNNRSCLASCRTFLDHCLRICLSRC